MKSNVGNFNPNLRKHEEDYVDKDIFNLNKKQFLQLDKAKN